MTFEEFLKNTLDMNKELFDAAKRSDACGRRPPLTGGTDHLVGADTCIGNNFNMLAHANDAAGYALFISDYGRKAGAARLKQLDKAMLDAITYGSSMVRTRSFHIDYLRDVVIEQGQTIDREKLFNAGIDDQNVLWFEQKYEDFLNTNGYDHFKLPLPGKPSVTINNGSGQPCVDKDEEHTDWKMTGDCSHKWKLYNGFMDSFYYCEICDTKKEK